MKKSKKIKLFLFCLLLFLFLGAYFVLAQKPLEITYPEIPGARTPLTTKEALPDYIRYIFQLSLFVGALIAFGSFVYGGFRYIISAGNPRIQSDARSQITAGIMGLIILVATYVILNTINPQIVAFKVSLSGVGRRLPAIPIPTAGTAAYVKIPLGDLTENLWGTLASPPYRPAECYNFDTEGPNPTGNAIPGSKDTRDRLECIKKLSAAIKIKAERLKEPVAQLTELYGCNNCCENCCENVCNWDWIICADVCTQVDNRWENCGRYTSCQGKTTETMEGYWGWKNCGAYTCCEGQVTHSSWKYYCKATCCQYFQDCTCRSCTGSICRNPETKEPCNYCDSIVQDKIRQIKGMADSDNCPGYIGEPGALGALAQLEIKMGLFPLAEAIATNQNICCPGNTCPPDSQKGTLDCLLSNSDAKTLIKNLLLYQKPDYSQTDENKLKEILKIKEVMTYLIEDGYYREQFFSDNNISKTILKALGLLENEVAINEIAWMGTKADPNQEWLELYNNTQGDINLSDWKLVVKNKFEITLSGQIPAQGFYLLENNEGATDILADLIYSGNLGDQGEILELYDQSGNLVEKVDFHSGWPAGDESTKTSMERINPKEEGDTKNWATNLSFKALEEQKKGFTNEKKDEAGNLIYGTPQNSNSVGLEIISYPVLDILVSELRRRLENEEDFRDKAILVLRKDENLDRLVKDKDALKEILIGENERLKRLLSEREVLRILFENEENLNDLLTNSYIVSVFRKVLSLEGPENDNAWQDFIATKLEETRVNSKLINDFRRDLLWVLEARNLMRGCEEDPISIDQFRTPGLFPDIKIEKIPEWEQIENGFILPGETEPGHDPAIFYCHKPLW